jgi:DNA-binding NarL/FixJ family response regulator
MIEKIKILLVDDHPLVREGLANLIHQQPDLEVCGEAGNEPEALELVRTAQPAVAIVDITLENGSGLELIKSIKTLHPTVTTLVLSMHDESLYAERALRAGARGYIMKREAAKQIIQGIRGVLAGQLYVSDKIIAAMNEKYVAGGAVDVSSPVELLSNRELEVFQLLGVGQNTRQISDHMHVGFKTVQAYCARIKEKLNLANANELLREAVRWQENQQLK